MDWQPPRGMRDFYPEQMRFQNWLYGHWRETALRFGFEEYGGTILEQEELFVLKSGGEIVEQLFSFTDKGGRRVALRPEMTPTLARLIGARGNALAKPLKWFSIGPCFRYERMSRGRKREHVQWNLDIVGIPEVTAEAELLSAALEALAGMGLDERDVVVRVSHRGLLGAVLDALDVPEERRMEVFGIIDKRGKESDRVLKEMLGAAGLPAGTIALLFEMLEERDLGAFQGFLEEKGKERKAIGELMDLFGLLEDYGIRRACEFSPEIVRGLPYYTGIVFEAFDREGKFRALFGGGRYDRLMALFGAGDHPAAGLGFGDVVIRELLEDRGKLPDLSRRVDFFLIPFSRAERPPAVRTAREIRRGGFRADLLLSSRRLKGALKEAARVGARRAVLFLPDELAEGLFVVRDLASGREVRVEEKSFLKGPGRFLEALPEEGWGLDLLRLSRAFFFKVMIKRPDGQARS